MSRDWRSDVMDGWAGRPVLVLGDVLLDAWLTGDTRRLCREAPVPVVDVASIRYAGGGAANTAANLAALGTRPTLIAAVGADPAADTLHTLMREAATPAHLLPVPGRHTMVKHRLLVDGQVIARFDEGDTGPLPPAQHERLCRLVADALTPGAAVVVCDYATGTVPEALIDLLTAARDRLDLLAVDARDLGRWRSTRPDLVTPNLAEAAGLLGDPQPARPDRMRWARQRLTEVRTASAAGTAAITLDTDGTIAVDGSGAVHRTQTAPTSSVHAAGAGDSYLAGFVSALLAGADTGTASQVAQATANAVLAGEGTDVCSPHTVQAGLAHHQPPDTAPNRATSPNPATSPNRTTSGATAIPAGGAVTDETTLTARVDAARAAGHRIVFTNGCFDVLHRGHVGYLAEARQLGDLLIVAVNSDHSVRRLKGPDRPINPVNDRAGVLAALSCVDCVVVFDEDSPTALLRMVRPDVYVKGGDYPPEMIPEAGLVRRLGGQVRTLSYLPDRSTSAIIERIRQDAPVRAGSGDRPPGPPAP